MDVYADGVGKLMETVGMTVHVDGAPIAGGPPPTPASYIQDGLIVQYDIDGGQLRSNTTFYTCQNSCQTEWTCEMCVLPFDDITPILSTNVRWATNTWSTGFFASAYPINAIYTGGAYYDGTARVPFKSGEAWCYSNVSKGDGTGIHYKDGVLYGSYGMNLSRTWSDSKTRDIQVSNSKFTPNLMSVRVYSRALTAAEVATNHAIDKARFNLS